MGTSLSAADASSSSPKLIGSLVEETESLVEESESE